MGKKTKDIDGTLTASFPLDPIPLFALMLVTAANQLELIKKSPDYTTTQAVQDAVAKVQAAIDALTKTLGQLDGLNAQIGTLETQRLQDAAALHRSHDGLVSAVNDAAKGTRAKILSWGGAVAGRNKIEPTTDAPKEVRGKSKPGTHSAVFQCKADSSAVCYLFQSGANPADVDNWPPPVIESGARHTMENLTVGQKVYCRVAIQRRKVGQGQWSGVVEAIVK